MKRVPQFRLRTLMLVVMIIALSLTTVIQSVRVQNLEARLQEQRAREAVARLQALQAERQAQSAAEWLTLRTGRPAAEPTKPSQTTRPTDQNAKGQPK